MLYLSLILIISGIFFIIYTVFAGVKKNHGNIQGKVPGPEVSSPAGIDASAGESCGNKPENNKNEEKISVPDVVNNSIEDNGSGTAGDDFLRDAGIVAGISDNIRSDIIRNEIMKVESSVSAVLYEDASGMVDYDNNNSVIDSSLNGYKSIKRIAAGELEVSRGGVNFRSGKKVFRFDFSRMNTIKSGNNFIALSLKGSNVFRLFVFKKNTAFSSGINHVYNSYLAHVL